MIRNQEVLLISDLVNACVGNFLVLFLSDQADNAGNLFEVFANFTTLAHIFCKIKLFRSYTSAMVLCTRTWWLGGVLRRFLISDSPA